jgi:hypothetical protein
MRLSEELLLVASLHDEPVSKGRKLFHAAGIGVAKLTTSRR